MNNPYIKKYKINNTIENNNFINITTNVENEIYKLKSFINKLSIINIKIKEYITHGSFSTVYNTSNSKKIFKIIEKRDNEIKALIFHYLLLEYYKKNNKNKIYFVDLYDFGILKEGYYSLMEKFGISLYDSLYKNLNNKKKNNNYDNNFNYLFEIFYQCCYSLKLLHDLEYLHLDIKPDNFLYYNDQIKIIDFGNVTKNETIIDPIYFQTTPYYQAFDWLYEKKNKTIKLTYSYDIFSLGCMFVELLYIILLNK